MDNTQHAINLAIKLFGSGYSLFDVKAIQNALDDAEKRGRESGELAEIEHQTRMARGAADFIKREAERQGKTR